MAKDDFYEPSNVSIYLKPHPPHTHSMIATIIISELYCQERGHRTRTEEIKLVRLTGRERDEWTEGVLSHSHPLALNPSASPL